MCEFCSGRLDREALDRLKDALPETVEAGASTEGLIGSTTLVAEPQAPKNNDQPDGADAAEASGFNFAAIAAVDAFDFGSTTGQGATAASTWTAQYQSGQGQSMMAPMSGPSSSLESTGDDGSLVFVSTDEWLS